MLILNPAGSQHSTSCLKHAAALCACAPHSSVHHLARHCRLHAGTITHRQPHGFRVLPATCRLRLDLTLTVLFPAGWAGAEDQDARHGRLHQAHHLEEGHRVRRHQLVQGLPRGVAHRRPEVRPVSASCFPMSTAAGSPTSGSPQPRSDECGVVTLKRIVAATAQKVACQLHFPYVTE